MQYNNTTSTSSGSVTAPSALAFLPNELLLNIMSHVILSPSNASEDHQPATSSCLHDLANTLLYRCVVLKTEKSVLLFARTVEGLVDAEKSVQNSTSVRPRPTLTLEVLQNVVKRIAITFIPHIYPIYGFFRPQTKAMTRVTVPIVTSIVSACTGACTVAIAADWGACLKYVGAPGGASCLDGRGVQQQALQGRSVCSPNELILGSYCELGHTPATSPTLQWCPSTPSTLVPSQPSSPASDHDTPNTPEPTLPMLSNVTHLRIAEPQASLAWHSPVSLLSLFPHLTHVALPRRCNANAENDHVFLDGIKMCLQHPTIKMVVVVIFVRSSKKGPASDDNSTQDLDRETLKQIKTSPIWESVQELKERNDKLFVVPGGYGSWKREWQSAEVQASTAGPGDWWARVTGNWHGT
ncbi:hypothetical protein BU15DRAFT_43196 [Melanogaster broomeanus]|nr:hypothetical protein BU15DRAFT_43196 [Melanogaster broomeanus]